MVSSQRGSSDCCFGRKSDARAEGRGIARELINRIQNLRKDSNFNVTDKIDLQIGKHEQINDAVLHFKEYISSQVLAENITLTESAGEDVQAIEIDDIRTFIKIQRM